jgi:hypothetical protein
MVTIEFTKRYEEKMMNGNGLEADSRLLAECADRLDRLADALREAGSLPDWIDRELAGHASRCRAAGADLAAGAVTAGVTLWDR